MTSAVGIVTYSVVITPSTTITYSGNNTNFVINGLSKAGTYNISLTATNSAGSSDPSSTFTITTQSLPNLLFNFENNSTNSGSGVGIGNITPYDVSFSSTIKKQGTYSAYINGSAGMTVHCSIVTFPRSVAFWFYATDTITTQHGIIDLIFADMYISYEGCGASSGTYNNSINGTGLLTFYRSRYASRTYIQDFYTTAGFKTITGAQTITQNTWVHVVWIANTSTSWTFYVNNISYNINSNNNDPNSSGGGLEGFGTGANIGYAGKKRDFKGYLDSLQYWDGYALTSTDVNTLYTSP